MFVVRRFIQREPDFAPYQSNIVEWLMVQILEPEKEPEEEDDDLAGGINTNKKRKDSDDD